MQPYYEAAGLTLYAGDNRAVLPCLPAQSVDALVTDPPAGVGFMGVAWDSFDTPKGGARSEADWDWTGSKERPRTAERQTRVIQKQGEAFRAFLTPILSECLRVLKPGGHALVWGLPRTSHWTATALEDAGFEIRDCITHLFGQGFPKSLNLHGEHEGWGTALKPGAEFWWLARAPLSEPTVAANVARWGTGALNIDGARVGVGGPVPGGGNGKASHGGRFGAHEWVGERPRVQAHSRGRWPADVVLSHTLFCEPVGTRQVQSGNGTAGASVRKARSYDGGRQSRSVQPYSDTNGLETVEAWACVPECAVALLDAQSGRLHSHGGGRGQYQGGVFGGGYATDENCIRDQGGASRFYYVSKPSRAERNAGLDAPNTHPTVKSIALMDWLIRLITPPGGVVLDPFMGSGSTGLAAQRGGWPFIGIEQDAASCRLALARLGGPPAAEVPA